MAISHINTTYAENYTSALTVNVPSGVSDGDFLFMVVCVKNSSDVLTDPSGWTQLWEKQCPIAGTWYSYGYYRIANSEPSSYTLNLSTTSEILAGISAFSGVDQSTPVGNTAENYDEAWDTDLDGPSITIQAAGNVALHATTTRSNYTATPPGGTPTYNEILDQNSGSATMATVSWAEYSSAGATGLKSGTLSDTAPNHTYHIELIASSGSTYTLTADAGSYSLSGQSAGLLKDSVVGAGSGSYILSGQNASLEKSYVIGADGGSYSLVGSDVNLLFGYVTSAEAGSYVLSGQAAGLIADRVVGADVGSYLLGGQAAALILERKIAAGAGAYSLSGSNVGLTYVPLSLSVGAKTADELTLLLRR